MTVARQRLMVLVVSALVAGSITAAVLSSTSPAPASEPSSSDVSTSGVPVDLPSPARPLATGTASCSDPAGDPRAAASDAPATVVAGTDLRAVQLDADGERLAVHFVAHDPVPTDATAIAADVEPPVQWVLWLLDGEDIVYHLRAILRADGWELLRDDLQAEPVVTAGPPTIDGAELSFEVALADLPRLPAEFGWVALTTHSDPSVQDVCPDAANDSLDPEVHLRFPQSD